jgi:hypothetical protein
MIRAQAVNLPPWKIVAWYSRVKESLERCEAELRNVEAGSKPCKKFLPKRSQHWEVPGMYCKVFSLSGLSNFDYEVSQPQ